MGRAGFHHLFSALLRFLRVLGESIQPRSE